MTVRGLRERLEEAWSPLVCAVALVIVTFGLSGQSAGLDVAIIYALINLILVIGLWVFIGSSGVVSFGQVAFMAVGAYVCGMLTIPDIAKEVIIPNAPAVFRDTTLSTAAAVLVGGAVAAALAAVLSVPLMRLSGLGASIATLSVLIIVNTFFSNWKPGTSGGGNLTRIPVDLSVNAALLYALGALAIGAFYARTRFGLRLRASREDDVAARAVGVDVGRERRIAFTVSALMFGVAGGLYGHTVGSFSAGDFYLQVTFLTLAMLVLGGMYSLTGAIVGTALLSALSYIVEQWENSESALGLSLQVPSGTRELLIAGVLILTLLLRPEGLMRGRELSPPRWITRPSKGGHANLGPGEALVQGADPLADEDRAG